MRFNLPFLRARRRTLRTKPAERITDWTVRDWADLPTHHPRHD